ncbi:oligosaccharide flippase family protein [Clostridium septicum]|uniref:oligosaccharide flippase family protein n=1 Tax=Clostridium septicum TaxID=1504 RepID=UPI00083276AD|nr:oligosaccharide flippase family protein [Clostridium septicum]
MKKKTVGQGVIVLAISSIILKLMSALYMPILAGILSDEGIAIYAVGYKVFTFLFAITSLGVQPAITKLVAEKIANGNHLEALMVFKISKKMLIIYGVIVSGLFCICAIPLSKIFNSNESVLSFIFLSPAIIFVGVLSSYRGYFQGYNDMMSLSVSNIIEQILNVIFSLIFAFELIKISLSWGSAGGTIGTTIGALGAIVYIRHILNRKYIHSEYLKTASRNKGKLDNTKILKRLFIYSVPFTVLAAIQNLSGIIDVATVRTFIENDMNIKAATLEYYATVINVPLAIIISLGVGIFPKIIKGFIEKNREELMIQTAYCYKLIYLITIPAVCGLSILSEYIFKFVFNRDFGSEILLLGSVLLIFMAFSTIQNIILQGMNKFKFIITVGLITVIIKSILNVVFVKINVINVNGVVISSIIISFFVVIINHIKLQKYFKVKISLIKSGKKPIIASIIMSISILILKYQVTNIFLKDTYTRLNIGIVTLVLVGVGGVVYAISILILGGINKYELDNISPKIYESIPNKLKKNIK